MSSLRIDMETEPAELDSLKRDIQKFEIEREALKGEKGEARNIKAIQRQLADLKEKAKAHLKAKKSELTEVLRDIEENKLTTVSQVKGLINTNLDIVNELIIESEK